MDLLKHYKDELVISVDLRSKLERNEDFGDIRNLISPLSLNDEHLDKLRYLRELIKLDVERANNVSLVIYVQLKSSD